MSDMGCPSCGRDLSYPGQAGHECYKPRADDLTEKVTAILGAHRWKTMGVSSVECECGQIITAPGEFTEFPADEAFRHHIAREIVARIDA